MHPISCFLLLFATHLMSTTHAAPKLIQDSTIVRRVPTGNGRMPNGVVAYRKSLQKYGWKLSIYDADNRKQEGGVETNSKVATSDNNVLTSEPTKGHGTGLGKVDTYLANDNSEYLCPITIGGQTLHMNLDTGSSDLWIFSTALDSHERGSHVLYDPLKSQSYQPIDGASFKVSYGDTTSLTGHAAADTVAIGGVTVAAQALSLPTSFSTGVIDDPSDGIVGLGFQKMNSICSASNGAGSNADNECPPGYSANPRPTWFENAKSALKEGVFTVNFKAGTAGYYSFGHIDDAAYNGDLHYIHINNSKGFWQFPSTQYRVGKTGKYKPYTGTDGIADSGTSLLLLTPSVVDAYYKDVKGIKKDSTGYTFPCSSALPDFEIAMDDYVALVPGKVVNYAPTSDPKTCYGGIQSNNGQGPQIFGDILFKAVFAVFDYDGLRLGLAPHA